MRIAENTTRLAHVWQALTEPAPTIPDEQRQPVQFLSGAILTLTAVALLTAVLLTGIYGLARTPLTVFLAFAAALILYGFSRTRYYQVASQGIVILGFLFVLLVFLYDPKAHTAVIMVLPVYIAAMLRPIRAIIIWAVISLASAILASRLFPGEWKEFDWTVVYMIAIMSLIVVNTLLRRRAEAQLQQRTHQLAESEARYRMLADNASDIIWTLGLDGRMNYVSPAVQHVLGYTPTEMLALPLDAAMPSGVMESLQARIDHFFTVARQNHIDFQARQALELTRRDGSKVWVEHSASPMYDQHQQLTGLLGVTRDITDQRAAEKQALALALEQEKRHLLETFIQDASHDFRTPISILNTSAYLMRRMTDSLIAQHEQLRVQLAAVETPDLCKQLSNIADLEARLYQQITQSESGSKRLEQLVTRLLEMVQLDNQPALTLTPQDVNPIIQQLTAAYEPLIVEKGIACSLSLDADLPCVLLNGEAFERILQNLLDNAVRYTPSGGQIAVKTERHDAAVVVSIIDTGIGIAEADIPLIFERFYRADKARNMHTGGAGLGLTIVRRLVEAHGGQVEIHSEMRRGSTFRVVLPAAR
ncbi:MAG: PAS domain S-box protein [Anaerolineae bacterium]|nr:PAS domain S-box protein [Anaerolineae bacterium]